jgi:putative salt-induced outer membrane protein YdiY
MKSNNTHINRLACGMAVAGILLIGAAVAKAEDPAPEAKKSWETTAAAGLTITRGNRDTVLATAGLNTSRKWDKDEVAFGINGGYGADKDNSVSNSTSVVNNNFIQGFAQYNRLFTEKFYGGLRLDGSYDGIANLDYRITISPLAGYYLIKSTNTTLAVEVGPSAVAEQFSGQDSDVYLGIRFAQRFEHKLTDSTKLWQSVSYVPQVDDWTANYVVTLVVGIDTAITKKWSLRVLFQDIYTSQPAPSSTSYNELRLIAGTSYKFY